ncbi:hypothetical protein QBC42DRAFT_278842 [Cladorrhinum samala]|uniref:Uncharacterized protein n=1 Tax=Cladorrhinum samala TaxID=585594 RepID=A0AAV9HAC0_9PEZI|nr:hypothetical protein QBC42DRAFT_278842 [Cladorrhinum samala]
MSGGSANKDTSGNPRLRSVLESDGVTFHIKAGGQKWQCKLLDRNTHERQKAMRTDSSSSVSTESNVSSASSTTSSH